MSLHIPKIDFQEIISAIESALISGDHGIALRLCNSLLSAFPKNKAAIKFYRKINENYSVKNKATNFLIQCEPSSEIQKQLIALVEKRNFGELSKLVSICKENKPYSKFLCRLGALAEAELGNYLKAENDFKSALQFDPLDIETLFNYGIFLRKRKRRIQARKYLYFAIELQQNNYEIIMLLAELETEIKELKNAELLYLRALNLQPTNVSCLTNYFSVLVDLRKYKSAQKIFSKLETNATERWHLKLCKAYGERKSGKLAQALETIIDLDDQNQEPPQILMEKANILRELLKFEEAIEALKNALLQDPKNVTARWNLAFCELMIGDFESGWQNYESRWESYGWETKYFETHKEIWDINKIGRLLVWNEQGIGDEVMFLSLLDLVPARITNIIVRMDERLIPLFRRNLSPKEKDRFKFVVTNDKIEEEQFDFHIPMGTLPKTLNFDLQTRKEGRPPFLKADLAKVDSFLCRLPNNRNLTIGVSWKSSNTIYANSRNMDLENIISNINIDGVHFVNLQYGDITKDIRGLSPQSINKLSLFEDIDKKNDLEGLAALVMCCDLIVSIPNFTVHLAGGLGKRCEVLLKPYHGWEWHHNAESSYWYGSCKLHRIGEDGSLGSFGDLLSDFREVI